MSYNYGKMAGAPMGLCVDWTFRKKIRELIESETTENVKELEDEFDIFSFDFDDEEEIFN